MAESALALDPSLTLLKLRQLSEAFARHAATRAGQLADSQDSSANQLDVLRMLEQRGIVREQVAEIFAALVASRLVRVESKKCVTSYVWTA